MNETQWGGEKQEKRAHNTLLGLLFCFQDRCEDCSGILVSFGKLTLKIHGANTGGKGRVGREWGEGDSERGEEGGYYFSTHADNPVRQRQAPGDGRPVLAVFVALDGHDSRHGRTVDGRLQEHFVGEHVHATEEDLRAERPLAEDGHPHAVRHRHHKVEVLVPHRRLEVVRHHLRRLLLRVRVRRGHCLAARVDGAQLHLAEGRRRPLLDEVGRADHRQLDTHLGHAGVALHVLHRLNETLAWLPRHHIFEVIVPRDRAARLRLRLRRLCRRRSGALALARPSVVVVVLVAAELLQHVVERRGGVGVSVARRRRPTAGGGGGGGGLGCRNRRRRRD
eukprot:Rhum_TRINITY_DN15024_c8_g2::Rhum_TRINITY_DN15024_c8_g2_i1::g.133829::m.133829